jgi:alpha-beta hydrolase superfamily lysophospholipase
MVQFPSGQFNLQATLDLPDASQCAAAPGATPVPAVLFCHGFTGHRLESRRSYARLGAMLASEGIASFRFDHRGCGESDGDFVDFTPAGILEDLDAALTAFLSITNLDLARTAVVGYSLGGCSASYLLYKRPQFVTAALWAPVARPEIIRDRLAQYPNFAGYETRGYMDYGGFRVSRHYLDDVGQTLKPLEWIREYGKPVLFLQGADDDIVKPEQTERFLAARNNSNDVAEYIPGADHGFTTADNFDTVLSRTYDWLIAKLG